VIDITLIYGFVFLLIVGVLFIFLFKKDKKRTKKSLKIGNKFLAKNIIRIFAIFLLVNLLEMFIPQNSINNFMLKLSGVMGTFVSALFGSIMIGPPASGYVLGQFFMQRGVTISYIAAFLATWVMIGIVAIPFELKTFGTKFTLVRNTIFFLSAVAIALIMGVLL
jgi:uncharacterized membrane protein YraQ (UPF0718 family)